MTIAAQIGKVHASIEAIGRANEFVQATKFMMGRRRGEDPVHLATKARASDRVVEFCKAATAPGTTTDATWGAPLSVSVLADAFLASIAATSLFDLLWPSMLQAPLNTSIVVQSGSFSGAAITESHVKGLSKLSLAASDLDPAKIAVLMSVSAELLKMSGPLGINLLRRELQTAVSRATNTWFLATVGASATSVASSGFTAIAVRQDLRTLLANVNSGADSKLYLIATRKICEALAVLQDSAGAAAFPQATVQGGSIGGIPIACIDEVTDGELWLLDAAQCAAGVQGTLQLDTSTEAVIQFESTPDSPVSASTNLVSLFQSDLVAVKAERWLGVKLLNSNAICKITGIGYTGSSPS
jgi:Phage capsid family